MEPCIQWRISPELQTPRLRDHRAARIPSCRRAAQESLRIYWWPSRHKPSCLPRWQFGWQILLQELPSANNKLQGAYVLLRRNYAREYSRDKHATGYDERSAARNRHSAELAATDATC